MSKRRRNGNEESNVSICDIPSRRDSRLGSIIGIIAIMVTLCSVLFRCTKAVMSAVPESGYAYYIMLWSIFLTSLSSAIFIVLDIILYVMADLKRYNVLDEKYEDYDKESDIKYATMIKDFKIVLGTILSELSLLFLISGFSQKNIEGLFGFIVGLVLLVIVIVVFIEKLIKRKISWKKIWDITKRLAILGVILAITLYIELVLICSRCGKVDVIFDEQGNILIQNSIDEEFGKGTLRIYDENGGVVTEIDITEDVILQAKTSTGQTLKNNKGDEIGKTQKIPGEMLYWKYQYNINNLKLEDGKYSVRIEIVQKQRDVCIINMFEINNSKYYFGTNSIEKEY